MADGVASSHRVSRGQIEHVRLPLFAKVGKRRFTTQTMSSKSELYSGNRFAQI